MHTLHLKTVDSTMRHARDLIAAGHQDPFTIRADEQTGGIGRHGRHWHSPPGGLWLTTALPLNSPLPPLAPLHVGLIVLTHCQALLNRHATEAVPSLLLKWPNDLVVGPSPDAPKLAGILLERVLISQHPWLLCGIGVNVLNPTQAVTDRRATSLRQLSSANLGTPDLDQLCTDITTELATTLLTSPDPAILLHELRSRQWGIGLTRPVTLPDGQGVIATLQGLDVHGNLCVTIDGHPRTLHTIDQIG